MIIKGNGQERCVIGKVVSDPKVSNFGEKQYTKAWFGVRYSNSDDGIINIETKFELADRCKDLKKHDGVIVVGQLKSFTGTTGKTVWYIEAELVTGDIGVIERAFNRTTSTIPASPETSNFVEVEGEDLPF